MDFFANLAQKRFLVGIDLGTTNCALSFVDLSDSGKERGIVLFNVVQQSAPGEIAKSKVLPSFLYLPGSYDVNPDAIVLPWKHEKEDFAGIWAREQGAGVPGRLVCSAKSWLCHSKVDRKAPILPWSAEKGVTKLSPVDASAKYLAHLRSAWNHQFGDDEDFWLENQFVIITVPASFDEVARDLTLEAAKKAGLKEVTLLEEPLAAFYSWLVFHEKDWQSFVKPGELICAVDVGGGTTDFTLITLRDVDGSPRFERIAVGDHLVLGGDNMDLALARHAEAGMGRAGGGLSSNRWQALTHQCRQAKEDILSGRADEKKIILMGEGGKLIGGTLTTKLTRENLEKIILEGFFPLATAGQGPPEKQKGGLTEFGLPYAQDPAVTRHLCLFLERHQASVESLLGKKTPFPDLLLFNGGALKPPLLQERIRQAVKHWFGADRLPGVLENPDLDLAVSRGAAYYGLVKAGQGVRVGSGSARGYYLEVGDGADGPPRALCLMERGVEEGTVLELADRQFVVLTNQPVSFQVYSSSFRSGDKAGDLVEIDDTLTRLPPIRTVIQFGKKAGQQSLPVHIEARYTELGALELWCASLRTEHRWRLQFQLRDTAQKAQVVDERIFEEEVVSQALAILEEALKSSSSPQTLEKLANTLAQAVEMPKEKWPLSLIRRFADFLLEKNESRLVSPAHLIRWQNLAGFCMRPGFGDALDEHRCRSLWPLFQKGQAFSNNQQARQEWWVMWRRVAGGLTAGQQRQIIQTIGPTIRSKKGAVKVAAQEALEIWMLIGNLERLLVKDKIDFGRHLLQSIKPGKAKPQELWALSRLGARELLYGPLDRVIPVEEAVNWIDSLLSMEWNNPRPAAQALCLLARKTGDRKRDVPPPAAKRVEEWLTAHNGTEQQIKMVTSPVVDDRQLQEEQFGEALPTGIVLF